MKYGAINIDPDTMEEHRYLWAQEFLSGTLRLHRDRETLNEFLENFPKSRKSMPLKCFKWQGRR